MLPVTIDEEFLENHGACRDQALGFLRLFPKGVRTDEITLSMIQKVRAADITPDWIMYIGIFSNEEVRQYENALKPFRDAYNKDRDLEKWAKGVDTVLLRFVNPKAFGNKVCPHCGVPVEASKKKAVKAAIIKVRPKVKRKVTKKAVLLNGKKVTRKR